MVTNLMLTPPVTTRLRGGWLPSLSNQRMISGLTSLSGVSAAAASVITVEYPQWSSTREQTVELSRIMMSSLSMQRLAQMINSTYMWIYMHNNIVTSIIILHQA